MDADLTAAIAAATAYLRTLLPLVVAACPGDDRASAALDAATRPGLGPVHRQAIFEAAYAAKDANQGLGGRCATLRARLEMANQELLRWELASPQYVDHVQLATARRWHAQVLAEYEAASVAQCVVSACESVAFAALQARGGTIADPRAALRSAARVDRNIAHARRCCGFVAASRSGPIVGLPRWDHRSSGSVPMAPVAYP